MTVRGARYTHKFQGLTVDQVCRITGATPNTVRGWIHRGHIKRNEWGLLDLDDVRGYLATRGSAWEDEGHGT